jgi:hypothetical protein
VNGASDPEVLRALAARIDAAPSVARRSGGILGTAAAYLPGERIEGLRIRDGYRLEVHVVMCWGSTVDDVEREVLDAIGALWDRATVDLVIEDITTSEIDAAIGR